MLGFIIAVGAGFLVPIIEGVAGEPIAHALRDKVELEMSDTRAISIFIALLGTSLIALAFGSGNAFGIALGVTLGYFGTRLVTLVKSAVDGK